MGQKLPVRVYTIEPCPYCDRAKQLLKRVGVRYDEALVDREDDKKREELFERSGMKTFPQIFFGDECIGGYTELKALEDTEGIANRLGLA